jgi:hypothetical protein
MCGIMRFVDIPPLEGNVEVEVECDDVPDEGKGRSCPDVVLSIRMG